MKKVYLAPMSLLVALLFSCRPPDAADSFDKNTMKGSWDFVSATDGKIYGSMHIISVGSNEFSLYENSWLYPNPWYKTNGTEVIMSAGEVFAIKVEEDDLKNIVINPPIYLGLMKTVELIECSPLAGGIMEFKNVTDDVTYTYRRTGT